MSNLFTQLSQAAEQQRQEVHDSRNKRKIADSQREAATIKQDDNKESNNAEQNVSSYSEPTSPHGDTTKSKAEKTSNQMEVFDADLMIQIIKELSIAKDNYSTTLRISQEEKKFIEDFIHVDLRRKDVEGNGVSKSKLMRYALTYVVLNHRKDFANALVAALKEEKKIGLLT
jgi:hypothetical protein